MAATDTEADRDRRVKAYLAELDRIKDQLAEVPSLYDRRIQLFELLRLEEPPVPFADIAAHTDASPEAVRVALNKKRRADAGNPISRSG